VTTANVCLTLIAARKLKQELFDYLSEQTDLVPGFTASEAAGHGPTMRLHSPAEQVKGRADCVTVYIIVNDEAAERLLERLKAAFMGAHIVYWTVPVTRLGLIE
jgi:nitrogen regulatory protein PII